MKDGELKKILYMFIFVINIGNYIKNKIYEFIFKEILFRI